MRIRALFALALLSLATCTNDLPVGPGGAGGGDLAIRPVFPASFAVFAQALSIDAARVSATRPGDTVVVFQQTVTFNPNDSVLALAVKVPFTADTASFDVTLTFLSKAGVPLFQCVFPSLALSRSAPATPVDFSVTYVGPGDSAVAVSVSPNVDTVSADTTLQFSVSAINALQAAVTQVYVHWSSSNPAAPIDATGKLKGPGVAGQTVVHALVPSMYGTLQDSAVITFVGAPPPAAGSFHGTVVDGTTQLGIGGDTVRASLPGVGTTYTAITASDGTFSLGPLPAGSYDISFSSGGYTGTKYLGAVMPSGSGLVVSLPPVPLATFTGKPGALSGTVMDAQTGAALPGATVLLEAYANAQGTTPVASTTADTLGAFSFTAQPEGTYTLEVSDSGYVTATRTALIYGSTTTGGQNVVMSKGGLGFRVVLTWDSLPPDLDLHAIVPDSLGALSEIYYSNPGDTATTQLDYDVTSGYGPETITIYKEFTGTYTFGVVNYSAGTGLTPDTTVTTLARSGAIVRVYDNNALLATYPVPNQAGTRWKVFSWNGTALTTINQMSYDTAGTGTFTVSRPGAGLSKKR